MRGQGQGVVRGWVQPVCRGSSPRQGKEHVFNCATPSAASAAVGAWQLLVKCAIDGWEVSRPCYMLGSVRSKQCHGMLSVGVCGVRGTAAVPLATCARWYTHGGHFSLTAVRDEDNKTLSPALVGCAHAPPCMRAHPVLIPSFRAPLQASVQDRALQRAARDPRRVRRQQEGLQRLLNLDRKSGPWKRLSGGPWVASAALVSAAAAPEMATPWAFDRR